VSQLPEISKLEKSNFNIMLNRVIFLGTGAGMPTIKRNVASVTVFLDESGDFWLFDCGEGTQQRINAAGLKLSKLKAIFISHLHGDHLFGLPGLLASRGLQGIEKDIDIFGPLGLEEYLDNCFDYSRTYIPYSYHVHQIEPKKFKRKQLLWEKDNFKIYCAALNHQIDCFGYTVYGKCIKRNIVIDKLLKLGIAPGPIYRNIKEKDQVTLENGKLLQTEDFIKESVIVKKISYCSDTMFSKNAVELSKDADLLIHEATFSGDNKTEAKESFHSTIDDAVKVARSANVKRLVLTHISPRYQESTKNIHNWNKYKEEAVKKYPGVVLAEDFLEIKI
jgi:ribonuclease Z